MVVRSVCIRLWVWSNSDQNADHRDQTDQKNGKSRMDSTARSRGGRHVRIGPGGYVRVAPGGEDRHHHLDLLVDTD